MCTAVVILGIMDMSLSQCFCLFHTSTLESVHWRGLTAAKGSRRVHCRTGVEGVMSTMKRSGCQADDNGNGLCTGMTS